MLTDAKVDAVFFDCTNGSLTREDSYEALMKTWGLVPHSLVSLRQLYRDVYKPRRFENLWFYWKGKPCIMAS